MIPALALVCPECRLPALEVVFVYLHTMACIVRVFRGFLSLTSFASLGFGPLFVVCLYLLHALLSSDLAAASYR